MTHPPTVFHALLGRVLENSTGEIDHLIDELQTLRRRLQSDSDRIQTDIEKCAEMSEQVMQVTKIVSDSVQKLPEAPNITHRYTSVIGSSCGGGEHA